MRAIPNIFGEAAITKRGSSMSTRIGEDLASCLIVSGETSKASTAEKSPMTERGEVRAT